MVDAPRDERTLRAYWAVWLVISVCIFLAGGNDANNLIIPTGSAYNAYSTQRSVIALPNSGLLSITPRTSDGRAWALHPGVTELRALFNAGKCALLANVGTLVEPTTLAQYNAGTVKLPPQLFSHNDQQDQWHSLRGKQILKSGWGGRVADVLNAQTGNQQLSLNVSLAGQTYFQAGDVARPYVMGATGATTFQGFGATGTALARRNAFQAIANASRTATTNSVYERSFATVQQRAVQFADTVNGAIAGARNFTALPDSGVTLSPLQQQLRTVAKLISARTSLSMSRQIFFVSTGGFDQHDDLVADQPGLLGNVSNSIKSFYDALAEIGIENSVTTFTHSDFGRTLTSNGDGADHAWGGVQFVVGGAVRGQQIYGQYPVLSIGSAQDVGGGRFIPTTSADQYAATLASWFGVQDADLSKVAPSIGNFATRNLGFMT